MKVLYAIVTGFSVLASASGAQAINDPVISKYADNNGLVNCDHWCSAKNAGICIAVVPEQKVSDQSTVDTHCNSIRGLGNISTCVCIKWK